MSISTTSGRVRARRARPPRSPSAASPTTSMSSSASSSAAEAGAHQRLVVGEHDPDHVVAARRHGSRRATAPAAAGRAARPRAAPPSAAARSRMPSRPVPGAVCRRRPTAARAPSSRPRRRARRPSAHAHRRPRPRPAWRSDVGERLLHDAVGGSVDAGGDAVVRVLRRRVSTGTPAPRERRRRAPRVSARPGVGCAARALARRADGPRCRAARRARAAARLISVSAVRLLGRSSRTWAATPAWTSIAASQCATLRRARLAGDAQALDQREAAGLATGARGTAGCALDLALSCVQLDGEAIGHGVGQDQRR